MTVTAPGAALAQTTTLLLRPAPDAPTAPHLVPGTAFELGPETLAFNRAATLAIRYDPARLPSGAVENGLQLHQLFASGWVVIRGSRVNTANKTVSGTVVRGATYAVLTTPVSRVTLRGGLVGGALYVGQSGQLGAVMLDSYGDTLTGRPAAWTSSNPQSVTVDSAGRLSVVAPGEATITATSDGKSATTTLLALARPTADWSRAAEWTTFQGGVRHAGHVAATLDPVTFQERWVAPAASGIRLHQPVVGDGRAYVTTTAYFGAQRFAALDLQSGAVVWSRDFGAIHSVNPPTFDNGTVFVMTGGHQDSFLWGLAARDGAVRFRTAYGNQWSQYGAPLVLGDGVFSAGGYYGGMYRFDARSGAIAYERPAVWADGWSPAASGGQVLVPTGSGLAALDAASGATAYTVGDNRLTAATPVVGGLGNALVATSTNLISVDLQRRAIAWAQSGSFGGAAAVANGVVYVVNNRQVEARREGDGTLLWVWVPPAGAAAGPVVVTDNLLFVSVAAGDSFAPTGATYALDLSARRQVWSYPAGGQLALSAQGVLLIAQQSGSVAAISVR
ncbi:PQQ-binding-like beta-propeller repeat protein [Roseisolibacter sp. H3M3-2]|uniref:Ig-like domain-containing protein n=1 Tax=Roseisolibacter sp. H3M3-2 TaxID=3031323 RepID=UPI0023DA0246|nr:PQQ-binding-like beta-propeller repeat protein [Roseisolibacter sp. H3M3-2]MDF1502288.1 Ig-like domain-containing protein [Roseisolibacter sp. H3M3-2]